MGNNTFNCKFNKYLDDCKNNNNLKCAMIITDKQCAICTENEIKYDKSVEDSHNDLITYLESKIYQNDKSTGWESYKIHDVYLLLEGPELMINLPLSDNLSINQAGFLIDILGDICMFNAENDNLISIDIISSNDYKEYRTHNLKIIGEYILSNITKMYVTQDEIIIGKTSINHQFDKQKVYEKH